MNTSYEWTGFYSAFADKLLAFENDRGGLLNKLVRIYEELDIKFPKLEEDDSIADIDPFTIFGMFNKGLTDSNRISIIRAFAKEFGVTDTVKIPTSFYGVPTLNNLKAVFFGWDRSDSDIDSLWKLFRAALEYANAQNKTHTEKQFIDIYDKVISQNLIKWNITMGLFWIRPYVFISLDSRMRWFIKEYCPGLIKGDLNIIRNVPDGKTFVMLSKTIAEKLIAGDYEYKNFPELSGAAFREAEKVNAEKKNSDNDGQDIIEEDTNSVHYWLYSPGHGGEKWDEFCSNDIMAIGWGDIGDLSGFSNKSQIKKVMQATYSSGMSYRNNVYAVWQFANEIKKGDIIFVKKGRRQIIGRGVVESDYMYDKSRTDGYNNIRKVKWTHKGVWQHPGNAAMKTLTDITSYTEYVKKLTALFDDVQEDDAEGELPCPTYFAEDFLNDVYMSEEDYYTLVNLLEIKKNIILQGAPGVGKTYVARRLAYSIMGLRDSERVWTVQFHQSYSYEDFIMGYRPTERGGFELRYGPFYDFCKKAEEDSDNEYFFIIDEINRGNLSKIFGELFVLLEADKRTKVKLRLLYSDEKFSIPDNLYVIGMMNTADRSLAMLDYALRRRFAFFELKPAFANEAFIEYRKNLNNAKFNNIIHAVELLNKAILSDETLGEGFQIGHSYFCNFKEVDEKRLSNTVEYELIPMLKEYWFDQPAKVKEWSDALRGALK